MRLRRRDPQRLAVTEHDISAVGNHDVLPPATVGDVAGAVPQKEPVGAGACLDHVSSQPACEHVVAGEPEDPVVPGSGRDAVGAGCSPDGLGLVRPDDARRERRERENEARCDDGREGHPHAARRC